MAKRNEGKGTGTGTGRGAKRGGAKPINIYWIGYNPGYGGISRAMLPHNIAEAEKVWKYLCNLFYSQSWLTTDDLVQRASAANHWLHSRFNWANPNDRLYNADRRAAASHIMGIPVVYRKNLATGKIDYIKAIESIPSLKRGIYRIFQPVTVAADDPTWAANLQRNRWRIANCATAKANRMDTWNRVNTNHNVNGMQIRRPTG